LTNVGNLLSTVAINLDHVESVGDAARDQRFHRLRDGLR
jgi:hypothetical protein